jgi:cytochrome c556
VALAALAVGGVTMADDDPVMARHMAMEQVGDAMKPLGGMARGQVPFDAAVVKKQATTIAENLDKAHGLFPAGSETSTAHKSRAKAEIWAAGSDFPKLMKDAHQAALALAKVTDQAAFGPALKTLGASCKSCHDKYRLPEQ